MNLQYCWIFFSLCVFGTNEEKFSDIGEDFGEGERRSAEGEGWQPEREIKAAKDWEDGARSYSDGQQGFCKNLSFTISSFFVD